MNTPDFEVNNPLTQDDASGNPEHVNPGSGIPPQGVGEEKSGLVDGTSSVVDSSDAPILDEPGHLERVKQGIKSTSSEYLLKSKRSALAIGIGAVAYASATRLSLGQKVSSQTRSAKRKFAERQESRREQKAEDDRLNTERIMMAADAYIENQDYIIYKIKLDQRKQARQEKISRIKEAFTAPRISGSAQERLGLGRVALSQMAFLAYAGLSVPHGVVQDYRQERKKIKKARNG